METVQLYKQNAYQKQFYATVVECNPMQEEYGIVLDQTAFFPEGGGQYGDRGYLNEIEVFDTQIKEGIIFHKTKEPLEVGMVVEGKIDWERRYGFMQNHSAEHMMSGLIHNIYGYDNVGFHLGEEIMTLDVSGMLSMEQLLDLETKLNDKIWENILIEESYPTKEEEQHLQYRSKKEVEGELRIVTVEGVDCCACCAPHVRSTGEIGIAKVISVQKNKEGVRVTMLAGKRAFLDYQKKQGEIAKIQKLLSVQAQQAASAVQKLQEEKQNLEYEVSNLKLQLLQKQADEIVPQYGIACMETNNLSSKEIRELCNFLIEKGLIGAVLNQNDGKEEKQYTIGSKTIDVRQAAMKVKESLNGRGGGSAQMVQGTIRGTKEELLQCIKYLGEKRNE